MSPSASPSTIHWWPSSVVTMESVCMDGRWHRGRLGLGCVLFCKSVSGPMLAEVAPHLGMLSLVVESFPARVVKPPMKGLFTFVD